MSIENNLRFRGKVVLLTGANGGIGRTLVSRFAREGARLDRHRVQ